MAEKKVQGKFKLQIVGNQATPAPPVGPALGQRKINIGKFCQEFNARTQNRKGEVVPVEITFYTDHSFTFETRTSPTSVLLLKAIQVEKGSSEPNKKVVGQITDAQVEEIAKIKLPDLNAGNLQAAIQCVMGSAKSMGIQVVNAQK